MTAAGRERLPSSVHHRALRCRAATGSFTIAVIEGPPPVRIVGPDAPQRNPTLNFLRKKPLRASDYLNRAH